MAIEMIMKWGQDGHEKMKIILLSVKVSKKLFSKC
jgi:hypothetical protein